jgi:hypothetical protein
LRKTARSGLYLKTHVSFVGPTERTLDDPKNPTQLLALCFTVIVLSVGTTATYAQRLCDAIVYEALATAGESCRDLDGEPLSRSGRSARPPISTPPPPGPTVPVASSGKQSTLVPPTVGPPIFTAEPEVEDEEDEEEEIAAPVGTEDP